MAGITRFDHVGITVADLDLVADFFVDLGLEQTCEPTEVEGDFLDTVAGMTGARTRIVMLGVKGGPTVVELAAFERPHPQPGMPDAAPSVLGLRNLSFEVDDLPAVLDRLAGHGYGLVGGVGEFEKQWRMAYVRGPEGIVVSLAQRLG